MIRILVCAVLLTSGSVAKFDPTEHHNWNLLPHKVCGLVNSDRIIGGEEASMNAYPWLVRIGYESLKTHKTVFRCGGVLATSKIVITAAHCVLVPKDFKLRVIRLGEYNTKTNPDCEENICADPVLDIEPSEILIPKNYNSETFKNDIAMIRLSREIKFSASVKPICFISGELLKKNYVGSMTETAGWGVYNISKPHSSTKLRTVKLPILERKNCIEHLPEYTKIGPEQLCVGGIIGKDSCNGDSGGPLMKVDDGPDGPRYYILGIVSFGSEECGESPVPSVYTNMPMYMDWFLDNLKSKNDDSEKVF